MNRISLRIQSLSVFGWIVLASTSLAFGQGANESRTKAEQQMRQGNFRDAYEVFENLCTSPDADPLKVSGDLQKAVQCLNRLGNQKQFDELLEKTVVAHRENYRLLQTAARQYMSIVHYGYRISGEYERGPHRGGGQMINSQERDRVRALQLMTQALPKVLATGDKTQIAGFYEDLAKQIFFYRGYAEAWRLQYKTDLSTLPDYEDGFPYNRGSQGAPVDEEGKPVFYEIASDWENALNDGERWRFCLDQIEFNDASKRNYVRTQLAQFARNQFGVPTLRSGMYWPAMVRNSEEGSNESDESGTFALHKLSAKETLAKLATGVKRFDLPEDYNFIKIYEDIVENPATGFAEQSLTNLAQIHEDRRQYVKAAEYWKQNIDRFGPGRNARKQKRLDQITGNWGRFEAVSTQVNGTDAKLDYRFRNGTAVTFTAEKVNVDAVLDDAIEHIKSKPKRLDWRKININNIAQRILRGDGGKYLVGQAGEWKAELEPRKNHYDDRVTVDTPLKEAGAYWVTAKMLDGNTSYIMVWVSDAVIVRKMLSNKSLFYVADAANGKPLPNVTLDFFGYQYRNVRKRINNRQTNVPEINTRSFAAKTDKNGQLIVDADQLANQYNWMIRTKGDDSSNTYFGFTNLRHNKIYDEVYNQTKSFVVTDRPVYRPGHELQFKIWTRHAQYDKDMVSQFANRQITYSILNPKGEEIRKETKVADAYGGIASTFTLASDAMLGQYSIRCQNGAAGGNTFRVEEYKKPEFEVVVEAPTEPIQLGEVVTAKIKANYFFGGPVSNAVVKYTVKRQEHEANWFPQAEWDWCYGPGYWWFCYDTPWFPGFDRWVGCFRPFPWWYNQNPEPPEVVATQEVQINPDGTVDVAIDTALAKAIHGDSNHKYTITAEVRDASRRTIVGTGEVLVAQKPFKVFTWLDRGYYRTNDTIKANFKAQTLDKQPVSGAGKMELLKITYDVDQKPIETVVQSWQVDTNDDGMASQQFKTATPGQYRISYQLTDAKDNTIEGGYVFTVIGETFASESYRFNSLELIPQQRDYQPGETVKLQVNTDQKEGTVLLFVRPSNGVYLPPQIIKLDGKSTVVDIEVTKRDMPNFYVEAMTVSGGQVHTETKEIVVPPEKRILNVAVEPSSETYRPGQKAKVKVHVTDHTGENFEGSLVVSVYDKSVEYISGGSNTPDIREFFWKWRRNHSPSEMHTLNRYFPNLYRSGDQTLNFLGMFGQGVVEEVVQNSDRETQTLQKARRSRGGFGFGGGMGGGGFAAPMSRTANAAPMEAMDAAAPGGGGFGGARLAAKGGESGGPGGGADLVKPTVRSNFADTALWKGNLTTNANGIAEVELDMPENLTTWKINAWSVGHGTRVGYGSTEVITRKDLLVRLQAPRFFVQKDLVTLSAVVNNYLPTDKQVKVALDILGPQITNLDSPSKTVTVKSNGEARVDWQCRVNSPGRQNESQVTIRMSALSDEESDAMEMELPVKVHGFLKTESFAGTVRPENQSSFLTINVPADRQPDKSRLEIRYSPTLAMAMVDALPYLTEYPHGCTEQTLNRWLPGLMTQKMLIDMGIDLEQVATKRTNLNAQEIGDDEKRAQQWKQHGINPVWSKAEVDDLVTDGIDRLTAMQLSDGGWGWFSGWGERSSPHTTAVVVHGLQVARDNDASLKPGMLKKGVQWLKRYQEEQVQLIKNFAADLRPAKSRANNLDALIYMILTDEDIDNREMREFLYRDRIELSVYAKALLGLGLVNVGDDEKLQVVLKNIDQFLIQDAENETAYIKDPQAGRYWYYWYGSDNEANAYFLKLLTRVDPKGKTAPRLVKYLLNNRKHATYWKSTRDTALCIEAFAEFIKATGEDKPDMTVEVLVDGKLKKEVQINAENLFSFDNQFLITGKDVTTGKHKIEIRRKGQGPVYWNTYLTNFSTEDYITQAGLEVKVQRKFYKLTEVDKSIKVAGSRGQAVDQKVEKFKRTELKDLATVESGDLIEVELSIESKNDYEYLQFEDFKPAGFESVDVRSGYTKNGMRAYTEFRDDRVNFFVERLARGNHSLSYRLRAEIPGRFSALPARASAMYAPELRGNSDEIKLKVVDSE